MPSRNSPRTPALAGSVWGATKPGAEKEAKTVPQLPDDSKCRFGFIPVGAEINISQHRTQEEFSKKKKPGSCDPGLMGSRNFFFSGFVGRQRGNGSLLRAVTVGVFNRVGVTNLHAETERLHFLDEHVEGFRDAQRVVALDDAFRLELNRGGRYRLRQCDNHQSPIVAPERRALF
jgi:hypothetical protein